MVKDIKSYQRKGKKLVDIKIIITDKYKWASHLEDLDKLNSLRSPDQTIKDNYCKLWGIDETGKKTGTVQA